MIEYPAQYPPPLRPSFGTNYDFLTDTTEMQGGYVVQRRREPHIYKQLTLSYRMSITESFGWWAWVHRYAFVWHLATIQGVQYTLRYISSLQEQYRDFATVEFAVRAELTIPEGGEFWDESADGAPEIYTPPANQAYAADATGGAAVDLDFRTGFPAFDDALVTSSKDYAIATSRVVGAVSSVVLLSDAPLTLEVYDATATTLIASAADGYLGWHHGTPADNAMFQLSAGTAYVLRVVGAPGAAYSLWGYTR